MDVLTGNIGNVPLKAIRLAIEDNARLQALLRAAKNKSIVYFCGYWQRAIRLEPFPS